ncbi:MAG: LON peptidase substrate-binding domain-containing protein [bacterium]
MQMLEALKALPLFPLPRTVFFPKMVLPLHVFEPRYRQLVEDCQQGHGMLGIPLLKPGYEKNYEGTPEIFPVFGFGVITQCERLEDGRYQIMLQGLGRVRLLRELPLERLYRRGEVEVHPDEDWQSKEKLAPAMQRVRENFLPLLQVYRDLPEDYHSAIHRLEDPEIFCHLLATHLVEDPLESQRMLELPTLEARLQAVQAWIGKESLLKSKSPASGMM